MLNRKNDFHVEFMNSAPKQRISLLQNILKDTEQSCEIFAKEPGVIYCRHPVMEYFEYCKCTDYPARKKLAEEIIKIYGKELIFFDFEYLCENFPELQESLLIDFADGFTSDILNAGMQAVLPTKKPAEAVIFVASVLNRISVLDGKERAKRSLMAFLIAVPFLGAKAADWLFEKYVEINFLGKNRIALIGLDFISLSRYLIHKYFIGNDLLLAVRASVDCAILGNPKELSYYLQKFSERVPKDLFLKTLYIIIQTYDDMMRWEKHSRFKPEIFIWKYIDRNKVSEYFTQYSGQTIEDYRKNEKGNPWVYTQQAFFSYKETKIEIPDDSHDTRIVPLSPGLD